MVGPDQQELYFRIMERLEAETEDNIIGLGVVFGMDRKVLEDATPVDRIKKITSTVPLDQLANILEMSSSPAAQQSTKEDEADVPGAVPSAFIPSPDELPPPPSEDDILKTHSEEALRDGETPPDEMVSEISAREYGVASGTPPEPVPDEPVLDPTSPPPASEPWVVEESGETFPPSPEASSDSSVEAAPESDVPDDAAAAPVPETPAKAEPPEEIEHVDSATLDPLPTESTPAESWEAPPGPAEEGLEATQGADLPEPVETVIAAAPFSPSILKEPEEPTPPPPVADEQPAEAVVEEPAAAAEPAEAQEDYSEATDDVEAQRSSEEEDEIAVLRQLRGVRRSTVRKRARELHQKKRRQEEARRAAQVPPEIQAQQFKLWTFRSMMVVFILLFAAQSDVVIDSPNKAIRVKMLVWYWLTDVVPERIPGIVDPVDPTGVEPAPVTETTVAVTPDEPADPGVVQPPPKAREIEPVHAFVQRELRLGDLSGTIDFAAQSLDVEAGKLKEELFDKATANQDDIGKGISLLLAHEFSRAEDSFHSAASQEGPEQALATYYLGHIQRLQGRLTEARVTLLKAAELDPKRAEAFHGLSLIHQSRGENEKAVEMGRAAIAARPAYLPAYFDLAERLRALGREDEAVQVYKDIIEQDPKQSYALFSYALSLYRAGEYNEAKRKFKLAIAANSAWRFANKGVAYNNLAMCYDMLERPEKALATYEKAATERPDDDRVQYNLARAYQRNSYPEKAIVPFERAMDRMQLRDSVEIKETYPRALYNLAECYMAIHSFDRAAARFQELLRLRPDSETARDRLAEAKAAAKQSRRFSYHYGTPVVARRADALSEPVTAK